MEKIDLQNRIKELELEVSNLKSSKIDSKKSNENDQRFRNLVELSIYPILILKGEKMKLEIANDPILKIFHVGKEALGKPLAEILPEIKDQPFMDLLFDVLHNHITHYGTEQPVYFLRKNGKKEIVYFNFAYHPYQEKDGSVSGVLVYATDVTEQVHARKKVEESEHRYHNLVYNSPYMIAIFKGKETIIEIANDAIIDTWGKGRDIFGKSLFEILPEALEQGFDKLIQNVYETGEPFHAYEKPVTLIRNGTQQLMHYNFIYQAQRNIVGEIEGVAILANEVSPQVEAKIKVKESEERFRTLADNIPLHVFIIEPNSEANISYWNKYWLDYTGQTLEEALGRAWDGIIHPEDVQPIMDVYIPAFEARQPYYLPAIRIKRYDGEYRWFAVQANPRFLSTGEFMGYIGVGFDIHEKKLAELALQQSEAHFRLMADLMPAKISNSTPEGSVTYFNKHWLDFSGYNFEDLRDFGYYQLMHPDELEEFQKRFKAATEAGIDLEMEMRFKNKEGDYKWHLNLASPIKDENGKIKMWVGSTTEIQHQKEQRDQLEKAVEERTFELKEANASLKENNKTLQNINKELAAFSYVASHDLQEPLRKIQMIAGRILEAENKNLSEMGKNHLIALRKSADRMRTLIDDLLAFSSLNTTDIKFEKSDLYTIVEEVKKDFEHIITEKNATIELLDNIELYVVRFQFSQLMNNLIGNALKFSDPKIAPHIIINSKILQSDAISLPASFDGKQVCHITVSDNGIGFKKEFDTKIFEVFQRLHSKEEYAGTGIGLAIVKKIVDNHNGMITAKSGLNNGATFEIYIPID